MHRRTRYVLGAMPERSRLSHLDFESMVRETAPPPSPSLRRRLQAALQRYRKSIAAATALVLLLGALVAWYLRPDPRVTRVQELQARLSQRDGLSPDDRRQLRRELWEEARGLTDAQRAQLFDRDRFIDQRLDEYFALSAADRVRFLDREIDRMESRRERKPDAKRSEKRNRSRGPAPSRDAKERRDRARNRLDRTTPESRAKRAEFFLALNSRRQERGLSPFGPR